MPIVEVSEPADPRLHEYAGLTDIALRTAVEPATGLYLAEGAAVIERALAVGHRPRSVLVEHKRAAAAQQLLCRHPQVPIFSGPAELVRSVTGYRVHRGFLAAMHRPEERTVAEVADGARRILVLEDLVDHTNVGAAFRSAAALGFEAAVVSQRCADPLYRRSIKVSMGAVLSMPWARDPQWPASIAALRRGGFAVLALTPDPAALDLAAVAAAPPERIALLVGTEGSGLSGGSLSGADALVRIPMAAGIDSLNAAAATAVACYALGTARTASAAPGASSAGMRPQSAPGASAAATG